MTPIRKHGMDFYASSTVRIETPDGTMFVIIMEDQDENPEQIQVIIGKAGTSVSAWAFGMQTLINNMLASGKFDLSDIIVYLSGITTATYLQQVDGPKVRSGPEGIVVALLKYRNGRGTSINAESDYRPASFNYG